MVCAWMMDKIKIVHDIGLIIKCGRHTDSEWSLKELHTDPADRTCMGCAQIVCF